jgi:hypothetical protein
MVGAQHLRPIPGKTFPVCIGKGSAELAFERYSCVDVVQVFAHAAEEVAALTTAAQEYLSEDVVWLAA